MSSTMKLLDVPIQEIGYSVERPDLVSMGKLSRAIIAARSYGEKQAIIVEYCRRKYYDQLVELDNNEVYERLQDAYRSAQIHIHSIFSLKYLPMPMPRELLPLSLRPDPVALHETAFASTLEDPKTRYDRQRFEARRIVEIGNQFFDLGLLKMTMVQQPLGWITDHLIRNEILAEKPKRKKFQVYHDKIDHMRFRGISLSREKIPGREHCVTRDVIMRTGVVKTPSTTIKILYQIRAKDSASIVRKRLALESQKRTFEDLEHNTPDILALRLICLNQTDLNPLNEIVIGNLPPGTILSWKDRRAKDAPGKNPFSAAEYQDIEYRVTMIDRTGVKRFVEIQLLTAATHFNVEYSALPMNHRRYEARQLLAKMYPLLAPTKIYPDVHWDREGLQEDIENHIERDIMRQRP